MLFALAILLSSKAFVDYATSGLENPAGHLLFVAFAAVWFRADDRPERRALLLGLFAALGTLNRLDGILLYAPALAFEAWRTRATRRLWWRMALGLSPVAAWELFALFYYGFPFPNTYYAKIHNGIERWTLIKVGLAYLLDSLRRDPVTVPTIVLGLVCAARSRDRATIALAAGAALHLFYLVWIGGDHMTGRFLTAPLIVALVVIVRTPAVGLTPHAPIAAAAVFAFGLLNPYAPALSDSRYGEIARPANEDLPFSDERASYYAASGLLTWDGRGRIPNHKFVDDAIRDVRKGARVRARGAIGYYGYRVAGHVHVIDVLALADPLLARLPRDPTVRWRPGHARRRIPDGYVESLESGRNELTHEGLREYYGHLRRVTRGKLWSWKRFESIWLLNTGQLDYLLAGVPVSDPPAPDEAATDAAAATP
jgi:arabinofuranosyltransferase